MSVKSVFEFKFPAQATDEVGTLCQAIGHDMISLDGYLDHEVIRDAKDPGHLMVNTLWRDQAASTAVLSKYQHDEKIKRATELIGSSPVGFVGELLPKKS